MKPTPIQWAGFALSVLMLVWITWTFNSCDRRDKTDQKKVISDTITTANQNEIKANLKEANALGNDSLKRAYEAARAKLSKRGT